MYRREYDRDACGVGLVASIKNQPSRIVVDRALSMLANMRHRGGVSADGHSGDGAGILISQPTALWADILDTHRIPMPTKLAVGTVFVDELDREHALRVFENQCRRLDCQILHVRDVPGDASAVGPLARKRLPRILHLFVGHDQPLSDIAFDRKLFVMRRRVERALVKTSLYIPTLSCRTISYVGMVTPEQLPAFYSDLESPLVTSNFAIVHSRFSTNTLGAWDLAHPFRYIAHNGEINTIRGNENWMKARAGTIDTSVFGVEAEDLRPLVREGASDSARLDNAFEFFHLAGRELPEVAMMMVPPSLNGKDAPEAIRAYQDYQQIQMEAWDGPAALTFSDGNITGAVLDRNGLRPFRYCITSDEHLVLASESGAVRLAPDEIRQKGRLAPGEMIVCDMGERRVLHDLEIRLKIAKRQPYDQWVAQNRVEITTTSMALEPQYENDDALKTAQKVFGYTVEDLRLLLPPMAARGAWAIGSMGDDTALAALSNRPQLLYRYFKQRFAQVSNPAMDSINERIVMSLRTCIGKRHDVLQESGMHARVMALPSAIMTSEQFRAIKANGHPDFRYQTIDCTMESSPHGDALTHALQNLRNDVEQAVLNGASIIILSDRNVSSRRMPIPMLLATAAAHHHLLHRGLRIRASLICDTAEAREVPHFAFLIGYGAAAIHPYLALETIADITDDEAFVPAELTQDEALRNYLSACDKGLLKTIAKMGISTIRSYQGAQIFEAIGLSERVIEDCFTGTTVHLPGATYDVIARETWMRHRAAYPKRTDSHTLELDSGGLYQWRPGGEARSFSPEAIAKLQIALQQNDYAQFKEFSALVDGSAETACTVRGMLEFDLAGVKPVPLDEVEPATDIATRFCSGAMSYGSISKEAHETLAMAMNKLGGRSNTGEGGEDPARFESGSLTQLSKRSAIKQVASGRFGVTSWYLTNADEIQIKIAQGAKPGEGGELPGHKVTAEIARVRHSTAGVGLISPPPHHDIYSIEDLAQLIYDLKSANQQAKISVKLVASAGVGTIAAGVAKANADNILISGHDGGTGASPQASIKFAGIPWELGLVETQHTLIANGLRGRVRVQTDGGLKTGRDIVIGALLGADEFGFSTAPLVAMGCILMRVCHKNTCPVGIATQDPELRQRFRGKADSVVQYLLWVAEEAREIMAKLGFRNFDEMIGQSERLIPQAGLEHFKRRHVDVSSLLTPIESDEPRRHVAAQDWSHLDKTLDSTLISKAEKALSERAAVSISAKILNTDRSVGTRLGALVSRKFGAEGLPDDTITCKLAGNAGQSLGAFMPSGITLDVVGDANDYVGKGLSGGKIIVRPPLGASYDVDESIIIGNVALYGATSGEAFFRGFAGERFCVRNSGASAVVEGVGDHGCEYMTGGNAVVLGPVGSNFAAGMTGGLAFVYDPKNQLEAKTNAKTVELEPPSPTHLETIKTLLEKHVAATGSRRAREIVDTWDLASAYFVTVFPRDYKRALTQPNEARQSG